MTTKKHNKKNNLQKTKKNYSFKEKQLICKKSANTYNQFENLLSVNSKKNTKLS